MNESVTDRLLFLDVNGTRFHQAGWAGPWPPPGYLTMLRGMASGEIAIVELDRLDEEQREWLAISRRLDSIIETRFKLRNASKIPEPAPADARWFRGAEYVPVGDDA